MTRLEEVQSDPITAPFTPALAPFAEGGSCTGGEGLALTPPNVRRRIQVDDAGCWLWTGSRTYNGYGRATLNGQRRAAHRLTYEFVRGPIPDGLELDHLCRVRHCVNPSHLEAVTHQENLRRGMKVMPPSRRTWTHCPRGHEFSPDNTRWWNGIRKCRTCERRRDADRRLVAGAAS